MGKLSAAQPVVQAGRRRSAAPLNFTLGFFSLRRYNSFNFSEVFQMILTAVEEAIANLREATGLYLEEFPITTSGQPLITTFDVATHA